ncbi:MAG TPA: YetF domain-containing protein, partial [Ardenticatenaceae bacterium]|nr:YetF domain-containing protein [Ardenticatenaceae bacterium]
PDGVLLVATIIFWSHALNWLGFRFPRLQRLLRPPPLPLVKNGTLLYRNMRQELITKDELMSQVRREGLDDLADVETAYMEGDGRISVIARKGVQTMPARRAPIGGMDGVGESRGRA